ncbi:MAG TPA: hypothetical protein VI485_28640 [Vicinamibacterales bacterium]|nr:hypothetical protein [Vicinamibacterales bacterium]
MTRSTKAVALAALVAVGGAACQVQNTVEAPTLEAQPAQLPDRTKEQNTELGRKYKAAAELYQALHDEAKGGRRLEWSRLPDWSGVYSRPAVAGFAFDPAQPQGGLPTAKLTPEFQAKMLKRIADVKRGIEWDPISTCAPPGHPRWLTEPFLREFIVTPDQTWLINEMVNDIRRIYTDGRAHTPDADRYPLYNGDSIGFWDGPKLVIHTNQLQAGIYQRSHPDYTDQVETVEIWQKTDDKTLTADVWVYDPPALTEPWYVKQAYAKLTDPDKSLRIRYWNCGENQNNNVVQTKEGTTQFRDLTFSKSSDTQKGKP